MLRGPRLVTTTVAIVAVGVLPLLPAAAAPPVAGADYRGHIAGAPADQAKVTFTVSDHGTSVRTVRVGPWPMSLECGSGGDHPPAQSSKPARIKKDGFTAHVVYRADDGTVVARTTVTGRFLRKGREKGVVTTVIVGANCPSHSLGYQAHAE